MRRLQDVAAGIEDDVGRAGARLARRREARQRLGRDLQPRQHPHAAAHRPERPAASASASGPSPALRRAIAARQLHHEARVDAVLAGRDAVAAAAARLAPADRRLVAVAAGDQVDDAAGGRRRIGVADAGRAGHRAGAKAVAAAGAGIGDRGAARPERVGKIGGVGTVHPVTSLRRRGLLGSTIAQPRSAATRAAYCAASAIYHDLGGTTALRNPRHRCAFADAPRTPAARRFAPCIAACQKLHFSMGWLACYRLLAFRHQ